MSNLSEIKKLTSLAIGPGQLVQVYKPTPCCGNVMQLGKQFRVDVLMNGKASCKYCGAEIRGTAAVSSGRTIGFMTSVLRPINIRDIHG